MPASASPICNKCARNSTFRSTRSHPIVMAGLDPAIHFSSDEKVCILRSLGNFSGPSGARACCPIDGRVKPGHDE